MVSVQDKRSGGPPDYQHRQPLTLSLRKTTDMSSCSTKLAFRRCVMGASAQAMRLWSPSHPPRSSLSTRVTRHSCDSPLTVKRGRRGQMVYPAAAICRPAGVHISCQEICRCWWAAGVARQLQEQRHDCAPRAAICRAARACMPCRSTAPSLCVTLEGQKGVPTCRARTGASCGAPNQCTAAVTPKVQSVDWG